MELKHHPDRKNFQVDRLIFFTDALFAIAITLLVLEIHIPMVPAGASEGEFVNAMLELLPKFAGFWSVFLLLDYTGSFTIPCLGL